MATSPTFSAPPLYKELHDPLSAKVFQAAFDSGAFVGQLRTRLGIPGYETIGPQEAAKAMFKTDCRKQRTFCPFSSLTKTGQFR